LAWPPLELALVLLPPSGLPFTWTNPHPATATINSPHRYVLIVSGLYRRLGRPDIARARRVADNEIVTGVVAP
jgi:hypothetical protein